MMHLSKIEEFLKKSPAEVPKGKMIEGNFACQDCFEVVYEGEVFRIEKILKWKCSQGHVSFIENWTLY